MPAALRQFVLIILNMNALSNSPDAPQSNFGAIPNVMQKLVFYCVS